MRILQVNTADRDGGAATVAATLHAGYRARGHESWFAVGGRRGDDRFVYEIANGRRRSWARAATVLPPGRPRRVAARAIARLEEPVRTVRTWLGHEDFGFSGTKHLADLESGLPDVIHCHNLHGGYFDLRALPELCRRAPVVVTAHDAWLASGHCAHSLECERWRTGCGQCPHLELYPSIRRDATAYNWRRKQRIFARSRLYLAAPSAWLLRKLEASMVAPALRESRVIPNGVDLRVFRPGSRSEARTTLGIDGDARVILFVAHGAQSNPWKDLATMRAAAARVAACRPDKVLLLVVGATTPTPDERVEDARIAYVPCVNDARIMADYYRAADVYLHAAKAETFPTTILESLACGTPVVASSVGGIPEQIVDGKTGFLVEAANAAETAHRLLDVLSDAELRARMSSAAADHARARYDAERQIDTYLSWYETIVAEDGHP